MAVHGSEQSATPSHANPAGQPISQRDVEQFLADPKTHGVQAVERIDTHISRIFIAGPLTYKLKRALKLNFLDFSEVELRRAACERELEINQPSAPAIYRSVRPILRGEDGLMLGGSGEDGGEVVDWVVEMATFDRDLELDRLLEAGRLTRDHVVELADEIAEMHRKAEVRPDAGGADAVLRNADQVFGAIQQAPDAQRLLPLAEHWRTHYKARVEHYRPRIEARRRHGCVRRCHGDLHLGNIVLFEGRPTPFDAIEFSEEIATIDVLYDVAFPIMNLLHDEKRDLANELVSRYVNLSRDYFDLPLLAPFVSMRAVVRAMVEAMSTAPGASDRAAHLLEFALSAIQARAAPQVLAVGGLSGSGKSTLARTLAPAMGGLLGGVVIRSDVTRKRLFKTPVREALPPSAYSDSVTNSVYEMMLKDAGRAVRAGWPVVLDATFSDDEEHARLRAWAKDLGAPFRAVWLDAPAEVLLARVAQRGPSASDATEKIVVEQLRSASDATDWITVDAAGTPEEVERAAKARLGFGGAS